MIGKRKITLASINRLKPGETLWDTECPGLAVRCQVKAKAFVLKYRAGGRQRWFTIGLCGKIKPAAARKIARTLQGKIAGGEDPAITKAANKRKAETASETAFDKTARRFIERMKKHGNWRPRTAEEVERIMERHAIPEWGSRPIAEIKRSEVSSLIDSIEDKSGPVMADRVLAWLRRLFSWWAAQDDEFRSPVVRGMSRVKPRERARTRVLTDDEIRRVWAACDKVEPAIFGQLVKLLLLTGQRRGDVGGMERAEIDGDLWVVAGERYKTPVKGGHAVPLSDPARAIVESLPGWKRFPFGRWGTAPFSGFSKSKRALDRLSGVKGWTLHDLRRTAKTLMQRAGVRPDISERVLGHVISGVEGVYDRHDYVEQKRTALDKLAGLFALILAGKAADVVEIAARRATRHGREQTRM